MQRLLFEAAWDKTIAPRDREAIEQLFQSTKFNDGNKLEAITISQAFNHKEDLLVIVLIHNFSEEVFPFKNLHAVYIEDGVEIAVHHFSFSNLELEPRASMPWTFIFPKDTQVVEASLKNGNFKFITS